ncbi:hypothetical protein Tco_0818064 [Tanacetum coccineum]
MNRKWNRNRAPIDPEKAHEALAGPDPEPMKEDQTGSDSGKLHVFLGTTLRALDDEVLATSLPKMSSSKPSLLVTPPPINTEATTITTSLPEITPFIALQLRIPSSTDVDKYLGTKLDDALLKVLERHTADLIEKYSVLPGPESIPESRSERVRRTDYQIQKRNKMKTSWKEVARQGERNRESMIVMMMKTMMMMKSYSWIKTRSVDKGIRSDLCCFWVRQPPPKDDDQSSKKPRESDASATKQHPSHSHLNWMAVTDTRECWDEGNDSRYGGH